MGRGALGREAQKGETLDDFVVVVVVERTRKDHRQTSMGTVLQATLAKLLKPRVERTWVFPSAYISV